MTSRGPTGTTRPECRRVGEFVFPSKWYHNPNLQSYWYHLFCGPSGTTLPECQCEIETLMSVTSPTNLTFLTSSASVSFDSLNRRDRPLIRSKVDGLVPPKGKSTSSRYTLKRPDKFGQSQDPERGRVSLSTQQAVKIFPVAHPSKICYLVRGNLFMSRHCYLQ